MTEKGKYGGRKVRDGTVVSDKMEKTVLVAVEQHIRHPLYNKRVRRVRRFMAHDELIGSRMGDRVRIIEAAPISRHKRWRVVEVLQRAELPEVAPESIDLELLGEVKREDEGPPAEAAGVEAPETGQTAEAAEIVESGATSEEQVAAAEEISVDEVAEAEPEPEQFDETPEATAEEVPVATGEVEEEGAPPEESEPEPAPEPETEEEKE